ncbi:Cyclic nucleotide-binding domain protein [Halomicronema hongdechloris C2206]|uniref:Cyclic nucleotide-binding domain protein n=1 Tax=Halomicronema hongdechloris C2206 TaxID=1641165 RepID=A0A1Z3HM03_9CYAN|nr:cyclic nucleotide-binding domain-containing protein [Halomicronema hongdechloris]ASC71333.1 Cyclic nucleotide-binding domain protein [Halomicronema hongdechloris C2206]
MFTSFSIQQQLAQQFPFDQLPEAALAQLLQGAQPWRYRIGQPILRRETLSQQVMVILEGHARLLGQDPRTQQPTTLQRLGPGELLGIISLIRGVPCETVIASTELIALPLPAYTILQFLEQYPAFGQAICDRIYFIETFDLIAQQVQSRAQDPGDLKRQAQQVCETARVHPLSQGPASLQHLDPTLTWWGSGAPCSTILS